MLICIIQSTIVQKYSGPIPIEDGIFEMEVELDMSLASASGDPPGYVKKEVAKRLAACVYQTGIPINEGLWRIAFSEFAQRNFHYPQEMVA